MTPLKACVRCAKPSRYTYCDAHRPKGWKPGSRSGRRVGAAYKRLKPLVLKRDNYRCRWCGAKATTADHVLSVSRGGPDTMENLVASCASCNASRGADGGGAALTRNAFLQKRAPLREKNSHNRSANPPREE